MPGGPRADRKEVVFFEKRPVYRGRHAQPQQRPVPHRMQYAELGRGGPRCNAGYVYQAVPERQGVCQRRPCAQLAHPRGAQRLHRPAKARANRCRGARRSHRTRRHRTAHGRPSPAQPQRSGNRRGPFPMAARGLAFGCGTAGRALTLRGRPLATRDRSAHRPILRRNVHPALPRLQETEAHG